VATCEGAQLDAAGHVVVEEDASVLAVAPDDHVQRLRADPVAWRRGRSHVKTPCSLEEEHTRGGRGRESERERQTERQMERDRDIAEILV